MISQDVDARIELVADGDRRLIISHLRHETGGTTTFEDLVSRVHGRRTDAKDGPPGGRERLAIQLEHTHLPKLADYGIVEYERGSGAIRYRPDDRVESLLDSIADQATLPSP